MATKANWLTTVNGFITAVITQAKLRSAFSTTADELYPSTVDDDYVSQTYTTTGTSTIRYNITIHKSGNSCHIKGIITNPNTAVALGGGNLGIFTWKTNQYKPKAGVNSFAFKAMTGATTQVNFFLDDAGLFINGSIPANTAVSFDYKFYIAAD